MKKIGKKINYITKVFLALGLLSSNVVFPLKTVFAYEGEENNDTVVNENIDEQLAENENEEEKEIVEDESDDEESDKENEEEIEEVTDKEETVTDDNVDEENEETNDEDEVTEEEPKEENEETSVGETTDKTPSENEIPEGEEETTEDVIVEHDYTKELNDSAREVDLDLFYIFSDGKVHVLEFIADNEVSEIVSNAFEDVTYELTEDKLILTDGDKTITYDIVIYDEEYLNELIKKAVGNGDATDDDDINGDGIVDVYDVVLLKQMLKYGFDAELVSQKVTTPSKFDGDASNLKVGDTFTTQYVLTLSEYAVDGIKGLIKYNKDILRLDKVEVRNFETGEEKDGKFLYFGDALRGTEKVITDEDGNELTTYEPTDYVVIVMTFTAIGSGTDTVSIDDVGYFYDDIYYEGNTSGSLDINVVSPNNVLSSVTIAGEEITIDELTDVYSITVGNDVTSVDLEYVLADESASITSIVAPEELAVGENVITITVKAETGEERTYTFTVTREEETTEEETEEVVAPVNYQDTYNNYNNNNKTEDKKTEDKKTEDKKEDKQEEKTEDKEGSKLSKGIIIALILLAIAGLIYLIFKDEDDEETKKANKEVDKLKKEELKEVNSKKEANNKKTKKKER